MNKQTEHFLQALTDIEQGNIVLLDKALQQEPTSEELQKVFKDIEKLDAEREAGKKMFNLQSNLVVGLEMDKIRLEKDLREELDRCFKDTSLIIEVNVKLRREMRMLEKLLELNMKDMHNLAEQRDWYYERYTHYKKTTSS